MKDIWDKVLLFLSSFAVYLLWPQFGASVVPVLAALAFSGFLSYFEKETVRAALTAAALLCCLFLPGLTVFLPLFCYDLLYSRFRFLCLLGAVPLVSFFKTVPPQLFAAEVILLIFSVALRYRTAENERLVSGYNELRDTAKEMSIQLSTQNRDLMEKQDYEIRIATLNERNRIAREIHDNVGHLLSSSILQVGALLAVNKDEKVKGNLLVVKDTLDQAMNSIRTSVHDLHDESVDLHAQVGELVRKFTFCPVEYDYGIRGNPDKKVKYAFIAIVKESLSNIIKHSNATLVTIRFREHPALYQLIISDNGKVQGYDMDNGIGLKNITDRVDALNGNINITASDGFQIFISVPKKEENS